MRERNSRFSDQKGGGGRAAAYLSSVPVRRVCGALAGVAGVILAARLRSTCSMWIPTGSAWQWAP